MKAKTLLFFLSLCISPFIAQADHILGGKIHYTHISDDIYEFEMNIYRDCNSGGAIFDDPATITLYRGNSEPYDFVQSFSISHTQPFSFSPMIDPCVTNPFPFCLQQAIYRFETTLVDNGEDYHLVYQRCCKSSSYGNLDDPEEIGFTITSDITSSALQTNNSSPEFNFAPFFEICNGVPFSYNIAALESDADSIIYEFCSPIIGGGPFGTPTNPGDPNACDGVSPVPACPPPFDNVIFSGSIFSFDNPLGAGSTLELDRNTGEISGMTPFLGQFLVGICASEYVGGEVVSLSRLDLTFWVDFANNTADLVFQPLSFYPNPANERLIIDIPGNGDRFDLTVRDVNGQIVKRILDISGNQYELVTEGLLGVYFVELWNEDVGYFGKVLVF